MNENVTRKTFKVQLSHGIYSVYFVIMLYYICTFKKANSLLIKTEIINYIHVFACLCDSVSKTNESSVDLRCKLMRLGAEEHVMLSSRTRQRARNTDHVKRLGGVRVTRKWAQTLICKAIWMPEEHGNLKLPLGGVTRKKLSRAAGPDFKPQDLKEKTDSGPCG